MFVPKSIVVHNGSNSKLIDFSILRKKLLILSVGWILTVTVATISVVGGSLMIEQWSIDDLRADHDRTAQEVERLKGEYTVLAQAYIEDEKIARIIEGINPWLAGEDVDIWVTSLREKGPEIYTHLNAYSREQLASGTTGYSVQPGISLLLAVGALESDYRMNAGSSKGAYGPMQLKSITARHIGLKNRKDPLSNLHGGVQYLISMLKKYRDYPDQLALALASYNAGATRVKREWIPEWGSEWRTIRAGLMSGRRFKETRDYVTSIVVLGKLFTSGKWSQMDEHFWSNYRRYLFQTDYAVEYEGSLDENVSIATEGS